MPPLLTNGDTFTSIDSFEVKSIDYQGRPTEVGNIKTNKGEFSTFSSVLIKTLREYFDANTEPLTNVKVVQPRGKKYLTLESA
jgi:hypothetical protein